MLAGPGFLPALIESMTIKGRGFKFDVRFPRPSNPRYIGLYLIIRSIRSGCIYLDFVTPRWKIPYIKLCKIHILCC